ncbi:MAG: 3-carboxy-cis,cis-muconate cycloisomerase, partial [Geodermatophilaceae bacterium]|nr:3-carboxy-cis,cis-muconate cycloisomerase [Geodermatophilaceae bacterium]
MSALWDPLFGRSAVAVHTSDAAWVRALCDVEAALAVACVRTGLIDAVDGERVVAACAASWDGDPAALGASAAADGNP